MNIHGVRAVLIFWGLVGGAIGGAYLLTYVHNRFGRGIFDAVLLTFGFLVISVALYLLTILYLTMDLVRF